MQLLYFRLLPQMVPTALMRGTPDEPANSCSCQGYAHGNPFYCLQTANLTRFPRLLIVNVKEEPYRESEDAAGQDGWLYRHEQNVT